MRWGPKKFLGIWWSFKLDRTILQHAAITAAASFITPWLPIVFYLSKELREGTGYDFQILSEDCVGWCKCLQGFGLGDFVAVILVAAAFWLLNLPTLVGIIIKFGGIYV